VYRAHGNDAVFLTVPHGVLDVSARDDGAIALSGAENAVLSRAADGTWRSTEAPFNAVLRDGRLIVDGVVYSRFPLWTRPVLYGWLAALAVFAAAVAFLEQGRLVARARWGAFIAPGLAAGAFVLAMAAALLQRLLVAG